MRLLMLYRQFQANTLILSLIRVLVYTTLPWLQSKDCSLYLFEAKSGLSEPEQASKEQKVSTPVRFELGSLWT